MFRAIREFIQRGRRGYSRQDAWNINTHIARILVGALTQIKNEGVGYPSDCQRREEWEAELQLMINGFELASDYYDFDWPEDVRYLRAMGLFAKRFPMLWD